MLNELIGEIKRSIKRVSKEISKIKYEQKKYIYDSEAYKKRPITTQKTTKNLHKYKAQTLKLAEEISYLNADNYNLKKNYEVENELLEELSGIVYKMQNEVLRQIRDCGELKKFIMVKTKKCEYLKSKTEKMVQCY